MFNARLDQTKAIVEMGLNLAAGLKKQVDAGEIDKEAALKEFSRRYRLHDLRQGRRLSVRHRL